MVQPVELIPWKSFNASIEVEERKVPLRATIISAALMLFPLTFAIFLMGKIEFWWPLTFGLSVAMLILPLMLIFTIKQKNAKKNNVQPPRNLQFHDETLAQQISQSH